MFYEQLNADSLRAKSDKAKKVLFYFAFSNVIFTNCVFSFRLTLLGKCDL